jgi:hypothetical protein
LTFGIILLQPGGLAAVMLVEKLLWMNPVGDHRLEAV